MTRRDLLFSKYYKMCFSAARSLAANVLLSLINGEAMLIWFDWNPSGVKTSLVRKEEWRGKKKKDQKQKCS